MASPDNHERPSHDNTQYIALDTSLRTTSSLSSALRHERDYDIPDHDVSAETPLNNRPTQAPEVAPTKERSTVRYGRDSPKRLRAFCFVDWYWESAAAFFSLVCVVTIIAVLTAYQGISLSSWHLTRYMSLNTLVALLSTLSRTALIVPVASCISQLKWIHLARVSSPRPLREFQILDNASRGPWGSLELIWRLHSRTKLATWGALITIISLTMGPLSQQLLSYPSRRHFEISGATFYRTQVYDSGASWQTRGPDPNRTMDPKMQGAILNDLYSLGAPIRVTCESGNCEWDPYTTLAVTSECENVTSATTIECRNWRGISCNYITPAGFFIHAFSSSSASGGGAATGFNSTTTKPLLDLPQEFGIFSNNLVNFASAKMTPPYRTDAPDITECRMRWVARHVQNTTVVNGTFHAGVAQDYELVGILNPFHPGRAPQNWAAFNVSNETTVFPGNRSFNILTTDNEGIGGFLKEIVESSLRSTFGLALHNSTNMTRTMESISESITYAMGQGPSGIELPGQSITTEQYVLVHWGWISLPIVEVAMGIAFLVATLVRTWRKGIVTWKSSAIIPLLIEMEGWDSEQVTTRSAREVETRAKEMRGLLESNENGGQRFSRANSDRDEDM